MSFDELVRLFEMMVKGAHESGTFAGGLCGPRSVLARVVAALPEAQAGAEPVRRFQAALAELDGKVANNRVPAVYRQDASLPDRWAGLSQLVRSRLVEKGTPAFGECLKKAREAFDKVWREQRLGADPEPRTDGDTARSADAGLFAAIECHLHPWTPGSWMVWDVLSQWAETADPVAAETTPVLFASGNQGQVMRLVVEALPGPPGLVVPDWWRLGLCAFNTGSADRALPAAVQRVVRLAAAGEPGLRFRWHLDADEIDAWKFGLDGRSIEAATAVATLAVLERRRELQRGNGEAAKAGPVLDAQAVVTGLVGTGLRIEPVSKETLPVKLAAAREHGLDVIGVPAMQRAGVVESAGARVEGIATVGEAFELLSAGKRAFDRYGEHVRSTFRYHEEDTPDKEDEHAPAEE